MSTHKTPAPGAECACCFDDIESENYVEYRTGEGETYPEWRGSKVTASKISKEKAVVPVYLIRIYHQCLPGHPPSPLHSRTRRRGLTDKARCLVAGALPSLQVRAQLHVRPKRCVFTLAVAAHLNLDVPHDVHQHVSDERS